MDQGETPEVLLLGTSPGITRGTEDSRRAVEMRQTRAADLDWNVALEPKAEIFLHLLFNSH